MSLLWAESFDALNTNFLYKKYFASSAGSITSTGYYDTSGTFYHNLTSDGLPLRGLTPSDTIVFGAWFLDADPCNGAFCSCILDMYGLNGVTLYRQLRVATPASGTGPGNKLYIENGLGTRLGESLQYIREDTWYFMEIKVHVHDTTGFVELRMNEETWINVTGVDTKNVADNIDTVYIAGPINSTCTKAETYWDTIYILNTSGDYANDFLGPCRCESIITTGDIATTFSGSDGDTVDNFALLQTVDGTGNYVYSYESGTFSKHYMSNLSNRTENIFGIQVNILADKSGANNLQAELIVDNVTGFGDRQIYPSQQDMVFKSLQFETNETTSLPWTENEINELQLGFKLNRE